MLKRWLVVALFMTGLASSVFFILSMTDPIDPDLLPDQLVDLANGERIFWAGGCASCHTEPGATDDAMLRLSGGKELRTPFGTFRSPNISPDSTHGIGTWTQLDFVNAMLKGISPRGQHYYPAFPYTSYQHMYIEDVIDLKAFLDTLPVSDHRVASHTLNFPFSIRRGIGLWKLLFANQENVQRRPEQLPAHEIGRYLVEGPGHCGACHTPHDVLGGEISSLHLSGGRSLELPDKSNGKAEWIPNITPHEDGLGGWSQRDIAYALASGFDPDFDTFGGSMVEVQENLARLSAEDLEAIAIYLKSIPALATQTH